MWYTYLHIKLAALLNDERGDLSTYLARASLHSPRSRSQAW